MLLLCTSQYPTPPEDVNLLKLKTLASAFPMVTLGFSDHTQGPLASSLALSMGACVFEKHFTLSKEFPGPDHWFSADPNQMKELVKDIRTNIERNDVTKVLDGDIQPFIKEFLLQSQNV
mgnify:CR=1 FL=1